MATSNLGCGGKAATFALQIKPIDARPFKWPNDWPLPRAVNRISGFESFGLATALQILEKHPVDGRRVSVNQLLRIQCMIEGEHRLLDTVSKTELSVFKPNMHSLVLQEVSKRFATEDVLHGISFSVAPGERVALVGESGSGKTTLLRIIAGLEQPTSGRIRVNQVDVTNTPPNKRGIGVVFQDYATYPRLTVAENLSVSLVGGGIGRSEKETRLAEVASWLGLKKLLKRLPSELSGGQVQRVALGKVLMARPSLLLLDEPFSQLDVRLAEQMRAMLAECHQRFGMTQIMVTHDPFDALAYADKLAVLHKGQLAQFASPDEIRRQPKTLFAAQLTSPCGINVLPAGIATADRLVDGSTLPDTALADTALADTESFSLPGAERGSVVAIRPEVIRLHAPGADSGCLLLQCRLESYIELGIVRLAELSFGKFRMNMLWPTGADAVSTGDKVVCAIRRDDLMVFAE